MGEGLSKQEPEELYIFKRLPQANSLLDTIEIPERAENRKVTERKWLIVFGVCVLLLMPFLIYSLAVSDLNRLLHGYDQCGNVCGEKNSPQVGFHECSGRDYVSKPYLQYDEPLSFSEELTKRHCTDRCEADRFPIFNRCYKSKSTSNNFPHRDIYESDNVYTKNNGSALDDFLSENAWKIVLASIASIGVTLGMLFLFRTATAAVVWGILGGVLLLGAIFVGALWYLHMNFENGSSGRSQGSGLLVLCVIFTVVWLVLFCIMVFMYKRVQLVIQLLKEATKAAFSMPQLLLVPIITFALELIITILFLVTTVYMTTSGSLTAITSNFAEYKMSPVTAFTIIFNVWMAFWALQFIFGIQHMTIGGAVSKWYFTKNKENLDRPVTTSAMIVFKFHLGTVALGSMIITIVAIIRALLSSLIKNRNLRLCFDCVLSNVEAFIKYLSKNAYIITAMHGQSFYRSGKRAAKIIFQNALNIVAINYIGDFVLAMAQLLIVLVTLLITTGLMSGADQEFAWIVYVIVGVISMVVAVTFFSIFETTIDTIFLCFCEDSLLNDGMAKPYAMSRGLMEFIENSKKVIGEKKA